MSNLSLTVSGSNVAMPEGTGLSIRRNKLGKELGVRLSFTGDKSASALKAEGKAQGLKGKALTSFVDASLRGDAATAAWVRHGVAMEGLRKAGAVPVEMDGNKAGDSFKATFRVPKADEVARKAELEQLRAEEHQKMKAALVAAGVADDVIEATLASL